MSFALGSLTFDACDGIITPATVKVIEDIENPAGADAVVALTLSRRSVLTYRGFFAASQVAAIHALVDTDITAEDEAEISHTVKVCAVSPRQRPALCRGVNGFYVEAVVEVRPWA